MSDLNAVCNLMVREVQTVSGYDRVMLYEFDPGRSFFSIYFDYVICCYFLFLLFLFAGFLPRSFFFIDCGMTNDFNDFNN